MYASMKRRFVFRPMTVSGLDARETRQQQILRQIAQ